MRRGLLAIAGACIAFSAAAGQRPVIRWGGDAEGGAPYVEADPADPGKVRGYDVEVAELIARRLGRDPRFVQVAWAQIEASVERGDFEMGMSGVEDRPALHERHAVSIPYFEFREVLAVRVADSARFQRLADLRGKRIGTLGSTGAYQILIDSQSTLGFVPVSYDDDVHPYTDLVAGRIDAVLLDHIIAERSLRRLRREGSGALFVIQPRAIAVGHYVIVFARTNAPLRDSVDAILRVAMRDGSLERIFRDWSVWDPSQATLFGRVLGDTAGPTRTARVQAEASGARSVSSYVPALLRAALVTLTLSLLAMALAVVLGAAIAAGRVYGDALTRGLLTAYVEVVRGTPVLLQLFVLYYGLSAVVRLPAFVAAVVGLGLNYAAYESEIYRGALQAVPRLQLEAARTLGLSELQILRLVRGPQALRLALAPMTNDFVALLKDSSLVSVITVVELTKQTAIYATNVGSWVVPGVLCAIVYLAMSLPLARFARRLERRWSFG